MGGAGGKVGTLRFRRGEGLRNKNNGNRVYNIYVYGKLIYLYIGACKIRT